MKSVLISPYSQIESTGLRLLSACLKREGYETTMIFLPDVDEMLAETRFGGRRLAPETMQKIVDLCKDAQLVGITLMTAHFYMARYLTQEIKAQVDIPILWGGVHPSMAPEQCLEYADLVCIGEGERMIVELAHCIAEGRDYRHVGNLAYLNDVGKLVLNPLYPLDKNLDDLPFPDYDFEEQFVVHEGKLVRLNQNLMYFYLSDIGSWARGPVFGMIITRGCPYRCTYCVNDAFVLNAYPNWNRLRWRSPENVVAEIQAIRKRLPEIEAIAIRDDTFLANPERYIAAFSKVYKEQVGLPFRAYTTPPAAKREKIKLLVEAGMYMIIMGIESGAERIQEMYDRKFPNEMILQAAGVINEFKDQIARPMYDLITDNPYETAYDHFETLQLINRLPKPYKLSLFSLIFYPGTGLRDRAIEDGFITGEETDIYENNFQMIQPTYYNFALMCHSMNFSQPILNILANRKVFDLFSKGVFNRFFGGVLYAVRRLRLRSNKHLYAQRQELWLTEPPTSPSNHPATLAHA
jgi:anaerobic magnesium-protoporphyrin IX monomethyl ester cyclase